MDILSLLGVLVATAAIILGQIIEGGHFNSLFSVSAFIIVIGGSLGAVLLQVSTVTFLRSLSMLRWLFLPPKIHWTAHVKKMCYWGDLARRDGILGLENIIPRENDHFTQKALQLLVDGREPAIIRHIMEVEIDLSEAAEMHAAKVYEAMGGYTPTLGILGAVMGLIHVMENLKDPNNLGQGIATAFVATVYGVGLANLFLVPASKKLQAYVRQFTMEKEMILEGIVLIAQGENPRNIAKRLASFDRSNA